MKTTVLSLTALAFAASALSLAAQTPTPHPTTAPAAHRSAAAGACVTEPALSPKIPLLPPGPCAKHLYTVTKLAESKLLYVSPLVGPEVRDSLGGVTTTYSLDYTDSVLGTGPLAHPGKFLTVKYTGYTVDGTKFDSSDDHPNKDPITFPYGQHRVIPGWDTGFEGMHVGGKRRLYIPYQLAYGEAGRPPTIPAKAELIFDMELVAVGDTAPAPKPRASAPARPATPPSPPVAAPPAGSSDAKPATSPAGAAAPPPTTSSTPASSTATPPPASTPKQ